MSVSHASPAHPSLGGLVIKIVLILALWAGLVAGTLHYLGQVWPQQYQISEGLLLDEDAKAHNVGKAVVAATATPAATAPAATPSTATPAAPAAATAVTAAKPAAKPANLPPPHDHRLDGFDRQAFGNVSIFYSIVISVFCVGSIILQIFKYRQASAGESVAH